MMIFFLQEIVYLGCSNVVYRVSIFYYARNWSKSLLWWVVVVGGGGWWWVVVGVDTNYSVKLSSS